MSDATAPKKCRLESNIPVINNGDLKIRKATALDIPVLESIVIRNCNSLRRKNNMTFINLDSKVENHYQEFESTALNALCCYKASFRSRACQKLVSFYMRLRERRCFLDQVDLYSVFGVRRAKENFTKTRAIHKEHNLPKEDLKGLSTEAKRDLLHSKLEQHYDMVKEHDPIYQCFDELPQHVQQKIDRMYEINFAKNKPKQLAPNYDDIIIVETNDKVVGFAIVDSIQELPSDKKRAKDLLKKSKHTAREGIPFLFVDPDVWRKGIGRVLLTHSENEWKSRMATYLQGLHMLTSKPIPKKIWMGIRSFKPAALFWSKNGYTVEDGQPIKYCSRCLGRHVYEEPTSVLSKDSSNVDFDGNPIRKYYAVEYSREEFDEYEGLVFDDSDGSHGPFSHDNRVDEMQFNYKIRERLCTEPCRHASEPYLELFKCFGTNTWNEIESNGPVDDGIQGIYVDENIYEELYEYADESAEEEDYGDSREICVEDIVGCIICYMLKARHNQV